MGIVWDQRKNKKLIAERGVSFEAVSDLILEGKYLRILEHPSRKGQYIFLVRMKGYVHAVPFAIDKDENIVLKTVYRSRKFHKLFGAKGREENT